MKKICVIDNPNASAEAMATLVMTAMEQSNIVVVDSLHKMYDNAIDNIIRENVVKSLRLGQTRKRGK